MTLLSAVKTKKVSEIRKYIRETPVADIAEEINKLNGRQVSFLFRTMETTKAGQLFSVLEPDLQEQVIKTFTDKQQKDILKTIYADDIADMIEEMPSNISKQIIKNTNPKRRKAINKLLRYTDEQTGSIMSIDMIEIPQSLNPSEAVKLIKTEYQHLEATENYFVVNKKGKLVGLVSLQDLVFANKDKKVKDIMSPVSSVTTTTDKEDAALEFAKHDISVLPVVNNQGYLVGMITSDDIIDTIQEEATEDIHKMAGVEGIKSAYLKTSIIKLFKSRVFWLLLLMISSTLSQIVLDSFIHISEKSLGEKTQALTANLTTALIAIVPVISGAAGNAGSQSSTMVTRGMALGEIDNKSALKVLKKEFLTGSLVGIVLAIANFVRLIIYYSISGELTSSPHYAHIWISFSSSLALFVVIIFAKIVGGLLPLLAQKLKLDPAVMAAPLLTTLIDALSILMFFGISIGVLLITVI